MKGGRQLSLISTTTQFVREIFFQILLFLSQKPVTYKRLSVLNYFFLDHIYTLTLNTLYVSEALILLEMDNNVIDRMKFQMTFDAININILKSFVIHIYAFILCLDEVNQA